MTSTKAPKQSAAVHRHDLNRGQRKHGQVAVVFEDQTDEESSRLCHIAGKDTKDELLDVVKYAAALFDGAED